LYVTLHMYYYYIQYFQWVLYLYINGSFWHEVLMTDYDILLQLLWYNYFCNKYLFREKKNVLSIKGHSKTGKVWSMSRVHWVCKTIIIIFRRLRTKKCSSSITKHLHAVHWCYFKRIKCRYINIVTFIPIYMLLSELFFEINIYLSIKRVSTWPAILCMHLIESYLQSLGHDF